MLQIKYNAYLQFYLLKLYDFQLFFKMNKTWRIKH